MRIISRLIYKKALRMLKNLDAENFSRRSQDKLISAFRNAAKNVPAYKKLLLENNINASQVKDIESFKRLVPVIDKGVFAQYNIPDLCREKGFERAVSFWLSSGFSKEFSYSLISAKELRNLSLGTDVLLDYTFGVRKKKTLWISALGMGVKVYTGLPLAETSVRSDSVVALLKKISPHFEQTIITTSAYFAKKIIEEGCEEGINWKERQVYFTIGEDWFPENYRLYLERLLGVNGQDEIRIFSNFGISELGLTLFGENTDTIRIRRLAENDEKFRHSLFGEGVSVCPELMLYFPFGVFLEEIGGEFIFTTLNKNIILPLIRYNSKDKGKIISQVALKDALAKFNYLNYLPEFKLPLVSVMGRGGKHIEINNSLFTPEQVKAGIYSDFDLAGATSGYFRMSKIENRLRIELQLKEKKAPEEALKQRFYQAIVKFIHSDYELIIYSYRDFPYGMGMVYEDKFKYV